MMSFSKEALLESIRANIPDFNVTLAELERPTSDFMMTYFTCVLLELGVDVKASIMKERETDPHWECYKDTIPYVRVYTALKKVCPFPKLLDNFCIMSLMDPKPEDIFYVAVVDNFHNFVLDRMTTFFHPLLLQQDVKKQNLIELKKKKEEIQQSINDAAAQRSRRENEQRQIDKKIAEGKVELAEMQEREQTLQSKFEAQETELVKLRQEYNELEDENNRRSLYETLQKKLKDHQQQLAALEEELRVKSECRRQKAAKIRELESAISMEEKACAAVDRIVQLAGEAESATKSLAKLHQQLTELSEKDEALKAQCDKLEKKIEALQVKRTSVESDLTTAISVDNDQKKKLEELLEARSQITQKCRLYKTKNNSLKKSIASRKNDLNVLEDDFQRQYANLVNKMNATFSQFSAYVKKI